MSSDTDWPDLGLEITIETLSRKLTRLNRVEVDTRVGCMKLLYFDGTSEEYYDPVLFAFYDYLSWRWQVDPFAPDRVTFEAYQLWKERQERQGVHFFTPPVCPNHSEAV